MTGKAHLLQHSQSERRLAGTPVASFAPGSLPSGEPEFADAEQESIPAIVALLAQRIAPAPPADFDRSVHPAGPVLNQVAPITRSAQLPLQRRSRPAPQMLSHTDIRYLQRTVGNQALAPLLQTSTPGRLPSQQSGAQQDAQRKTSPEPENRTGLPDPLKTGVEQLAGISLDNVHVHYSSPRPAEVQALAYTQGTEIYLGPGQERHLPHEAWHAVQQMQGRAKPTSQAGGLPMNNDRRLENEAETMGKRAAAMQPEGATRSIMPLEVKASNISHASIQRVEDPDGAIAQTIEKVYVKFYKKYKNITNGPKPAQFRKGIPGIVSGASTKQGAYESFATTIINMYFLDIDDKAKDAIWKELRKACLKLERGVAEEAATQAKTLRAIRKRRREETETARKKVKTDEGSSSNVKTAKARIFTKDEQKTIKSKLKKKKMHKKLYRASVQAYEKHTSKANTDIATLAEYNRLTAAGGPLSTADMALAQASYKKSRISESLLLEQSKEHQVTMTRGGGRQIGQLGPYLPGGKGKSVQEIMKEILDDKELGMDSAQMAQAIDIKDPEELRKQFPKLKDKPAAFEKIRAMRHLLAVEQARGPEVALHTTLEHRKARLALSDITTYPKLTPLGPGNATTKLREAREKAIGKKAKPTGDPGYIPADIQQRAEASVTTFIENFIQDPDLNYPEGTRLAEAILTEDENNENPSDMLIDASANILRTPEHTPAYS